MASGAALGMALAILIVSVPIQIVALHNEERGASRRSASIVGVLNLAKFAKVHGREQTQKLPLKAAHYVAARSVPASVAVEVMNLIAAGNIPTAANVKDLIRERCQANNQPGYGPEPDGEIEALSGLLSEALAPPGLIRLAIFLDDATLRAARELGRKLKGIAVDSGYQVAHRDFGTSPVASAERSAMAEYGLWRSGLLAAAI